MELHPILESGDRPMANIWYVISSSGTPCPRVGHSCLYKEEDQAIYIIGGADPMQTYGDFYRLDLINHEWTKIDVDELLERYEHCAFSPISSNSIYIFGGANKSENLNSVQCLNSALNSCLSLNCTGTLPSPRTIHSAASDGDLLYIWGGGYKGTTPVNDVQLHVFNYKADSWSQPNVKGKLPSLRHGHVMVIVEKKLYIHGGMSGSTFHKDLHVINTINFSCDKIKQRGVIPSSRAAHAACSYEKFIYIFGGMSTEGALDDMYRFNTAGCSWSQITFKSPPPAPRLDHSMVVGFLPFEKSNDKELLNSEIPCSSQSEVSAKVNSSNHSAESLSSSNIRPKIVPVDLWASNNDDLIHETSQKFKNLNIGAKPVISGTLPVCIVFGGMDESGNIFNDVLIYSLDTSNCASE